MREIRARVVVAVVALLAALSLPGTMSANAMPVPVPVVAQAALPPPTFVNITLYGDAAGGWGFASNNITNPGPTLTVYVGDNVTLTLIAVDLADHTWFIDFNNDSAVNSDERESDVFNAGRSVVWNFTADHPGDWTYRCGFHLNTMTGVISIVGGLALPPPPRPLPIITAIMLGSLGVVFVFAAVYHVRAVRAAKRMK